MGLSSKGKIIVGILGAVILIGLIWGASSLPPSKKTVKESDIITITIEKNVGVDRITYSNIDNPGETKILTLIDLPYVFNCSRGDTLTFTVTTRQGYSWNSWDFSPMGRSNSDNDLLLASDDDLYCYNNEIIMMPSCTWLRISPTASPTPSPNPIE